MSATDATSTADGWDRILEPARADVAAARTEAAHRLADAAEELASRASGLAWKPSPHSRSRAPSDARWIDAQLDGVFLFDHSLRVWDHVATIEALIAERLAIPASIMQRTANIVSHCAEFLTDALRRADDPGEPLRSRIVDAARRATDAARAVRELYVEPTSAAADTPRDIEAELAAWCEFERAARARANAALERGEDLITTLRGLDAELRTVPARKRATDMAGAIGHALAGSLQDAGVVFANPENAPIQLAAAMLAGWTQLDRTPTADSVESFNVAALLPDAIAHAVEHGDGADPESCAIIQRATAAAGDTK